MVECFRYTQHNQGSIPGTPDGNLTLTGEILEHRALGSKPWALLDVAKKKKL